MSGAEFFANTSAQHYLMWWVSVTVAVMGYRLMVIPNHNDYYNPFFFFFRYNLVTQLEYCLDVSCAHALVGTYLHNVQNSERVKIEESIGKV